MRLTIAASFALLLAACSGSSDDALPEDGAPPGMGDENATRPVGEPRLVTKEGLIEEGVECPTLDTPDGEIWALSLGEADFGPGDYVEITGEVMDASICMQGEGTILPSQIEELQPPARDRDPARSGGVPLTSDFVTGNWVAKGVDADCDKPDFAITLNSNGGSIIETSINGVPATGYVDIGATPGLQWDEGIPTLPIETRGPDGLAVMPGEGHEVTLAGHPITGDGVVFVKCA